MFTKDDFALRRGAIALGAASLLGLAGCGGGPSFNRSASDAEGTLDVRVSAGGPVSGATVTVYAVSDGTGQVNALIGNLGVLGAGGPTDAAGKATVKLAVKSYSGPIQVVAGGANLTYPDPTVAVVPGKPATVVQIPSTFVLSSYLAQYKTGTSAVVPTTLVTTLADHASIAFARGLHPLHPGARTLGESLAARDPLWVRHVATSANAWNPSSLRSTTPASFTDSATILVDTAYAALFDLALNQLAHDTALRAGYGAGSSAITAITLAQLLEQDLDADAVLNGRGGAGAAIVTQGTTPVTLDSQFLREPLAQALDTWIQNVGLNLSGVLQTDLIGAQVYSAVATDPSDLFGDPPDGLFNPTDRVPPELTFITEPARYMKTSGTDGYLALAIATKDPGGVASVSCASSSSAAVSAATKQADGHWTCQVPLPAAGTTQIMVWGLDSATPPNSGQGQTPPYMLARTITVDNTPPSVSYLPVPSYYDELGVTVGTNGNVAAIPAVYHYAGGTKTTITSGSHIYKVGTRLGWSTQPAACDLEGSNPDNVPFLQFTVPYNSQTDAPITSANYSVAISGHSTVTGALWPSAKTDPSVLYFDLPLASNLFSDLGALTGPTGITITLNLADAAGNTGSFDGHSYTFHVLGPPLAVVEDGGYASANDTKSTYPYNLGNGQYETLYDAGTTAFYPENVVRLVHYFVSNPASQPVVFVAPAAGSWGSNENWTGHESDTGNVYRTDCSATCNPAVLCRASTCNASQVAFFSSSGNVTCADPGAPSISGQIAAASLSTVAYGMDGSPVATAGGNYIVPAASGGTPGAISVYVVRPRGLARSVPISGGAPWRQDLGHALKYKAWSTYGQCVVPRPINAQQVALFEDYWYHQDLDSASESLNGSFQPQAYSFNGNPFGEVQTSPQTLTVSRNIVH